MNAVKTSLSLMLLLGACESDWRIVLAPPVEGTSAVILEEAGHVRLWIFSEWPTEALRIEVEDPDAETLSVAVFESQDPKTLGLPVGSIKLGASGVLVRGLPFEDPTVRIFESNLEDGWRARTEPSPEMKALRFRDPRLCPKLEIDSVLVPGPFSSRGFGLGARSMTTPP